MKYVEIGSSVSYGREETKVVKKNWSPKKHTVSLEFENGEIVEVPTTEIIWTGSIFAVTMGWLGRERQKVKKVNVIDPSVNFEVREIEVFLIQDGNDIVVAVPERTFSICLKSGKCTDRDFLLLDRHYAREFKELIEVEIEHEF